MQNEKKKIEFRARHQFVGNYVAVPNQMESNKSRSNYLKREPVQSGFWPSDTRFSHNSM
jgi:hypothetical protein